MAAESQQATVSDCDWKIFQCARIGAPPLRFNGRCLDWAEREGSPQFVLGLFQRKRGKQVTVVLSRLNGDEWLADSFNASSIDDAISEIETYCFDLENIEVSGAAPSDIKTVLTQINSWGRLTSQVADYRVFVGRVLDRWTRVAEGEELIQEGML